MDWVEEEGYRWANVSTGYFGNTGFKVLPSSLSNIDFENQITEEEIAENRHFLAGSGVTAGDINGNGLVDLYFASLNGSNKLYQNLGGLKFKDITEEAGVAHHEYYSTGAVFADINGNGHLDLLVTSLHKENVLYSNDGQGNFNLEKDSGLGSAKGSMTMALSDITGNGYPDLYITNYKEKSVKDLYTTEELEWSQILNEPLVSPTADYTLIPPFNEHYQLIRHDDELIGISEIGEFDELYLNQSGTFIKVSDTKEMFLDEEGNPFGLQPDWGLTAAFQDLNNNGLADLFVCNDFHTPDRIWINQGNGTFKAIGSVAIRNTSYSCMDVDFSDIDRNGSLDIFTTEMLSPEHNQRLRQASSEDDTPIPIGGIETRPMYNRNSLYLQREDTTYAEIAFLSGTEATGWSWGTRFMDINLDGYEDILVNTGYSYDVLDMDAQVEMVREDLNMDEHFMSFIQKVAPLKLPNKILMNNGDLTFEDKGLKWGFQKSDVSHGMALADLNNNGTLDIIVSRMNQKAVVYENTTNAPRIAVRLKGRPPNTKAIGAKVNLFGGPVEQQKEIAAGGSYLSGSDQLVMFAADKTNLNHTITVDWPNGGKAQIDDVQANRVYEIYQADGRNFIGVKNEHIPEVNSLFEDVSNLIGHYHHEAPFDDFEFQPLLPLRLSQEGPGMAWIDHNQNGREDLFITSGNGGKLALYENQNDDSFKNVQLRHLNDVTSSDQTSVIGWKEKDYTKIIVGSANYEQGKLKVPSVFLYSIDQNGIIEVDSLPGIHSTTGPVVAADYTGNGYLDLFIGGRFKPGQYPGNADSRVFKNVDGLYQLDEVNSHTFADIGLVSGAVFSDFNQNGSQDLLISTEWGTLRLFENHNGIFSEITQEMGLGNHKGWWSGVATGDFTNNGLTDIIATNLGLNSTYQIKNGHSLRVYYDDFNGDGRLGIIEAYFDEHIGSYAPKRKLYNFGSLSSTISPNVRSHREFASASIDEIIRGSRADIPYKEINTLEHMVFINTGNGFRGHPLPLETQLTTAFHAGVADFDNNGNEDIFLSQNLFALPPETPRMDAGRGLILKGNGEGKFTPLQGSESGIKVYGEQRGSALGDFNNNGKIDLAISQNGAETKLYLNRTEKVGYRIRLTGSMNNKSAIGSSLRLVYNDGSKGPKREVQAGAGYLTQNSAIQVMGSSTEPDRIEVTWFDGTTEYVEIKKNEMEYNIHYKP
ncbi:MAG: FG-GAP-like repeat-containing protein [Balneolales bacterium]